MSVNGVKSHYFEDLAVGMAADFSKTVTAADVDSFGEISGDWNPIHFSREYAAATVFKRPIAHGILTASFFSTVLGNRLPGPGSVYVSQSLHFHAPVRIGDEITARVRITKLNSLRRRATLYCECQVGDTIVLDGEAVLSVPARPEKP